MSERRDSPGFSGPAGRRGPDAGKGHITGHVGTLSFQSEQELTDYLESLGDEISGFYKADSDSRPYNF